MSKRFGSVAVVGLVLFGALARGADWTRFRGPDGLGTSAETGLAVEWSASKNIIWRTELPGPGSSSPIVLGDRIFVTCYSGYGLVPSEGDVNDLMRHVLCLERATGTVRWKKDFEPKLPESLYQGGNDARHGYGSSTPTTDGRHLFVSFGKSGVHCLDLDGNQVWHTDVGSGTRGWGSSNSLVLFENRLIVNASIESGSLLGLDKTSGKEDWRAGGIRGSWNTPLLVPLPGGQTELVVNMPGNPTGRMVAYDPGTGKELWNCEAIPDSGYVCPSVVAHAGIVYAIGGRRNTAVAVRAGGRGDVTATHKLWSTACGSNVSSPVFHDGHLYWVHESRGIAYCLDAPTGSVVFEQRLEPRPGLVYASATAADGKLYFVSQHNGTYVLAARPRFELLAHNRFEDDDSRSNASPAIVDGQIFWRNDRHLYCIGKK